MRVVVPYTNLHPLTDAALKELAPAAERVALERDPFSYGRLLSRLWADREDFLIVEHDIVPTAEALLEAEECDCLWGLSPYPAGNKGLLKGALGFTRFAKELMEDAPDVMVEAITTYNGGAATPPGHWLMMDARLSRSLTCRGYRFHVHESVVGHEHCYAPAGCACSNCNG